MRNIVRDYVDKFIHEREAKIRLIRILVLLGLVVTIAVFWELHVTGIAMTNETNCGLEEHTHTEECYAEVLVCGLEETEAVPGHTHTDACYETVTTLICGQEESAGTPAVEGHTHSDACYDEEGTLICGQEERESIPAVEGHTHTDACYSTETVLACGQEESEGTEGHTHTDACYEKQLVCGKEEHTHTLACMSDDTADVETASVWEDTLPDELSGIWVDDLISVAQSQLGYTESTENYVVNDSGKKKGYTRYGAWYGDPYGDWCAMFVSFCLNYADIGTDLMPRNSGCYAWTVALDEANMYADSSDYTPKVGDIVFFDWTGDGRSNHVGIVEEVTYCTATGVTLGEDDIENIYVDEDGRTVIDLETEAAIDETAIGEAGIDETNLVIGTDFEETDTVTETVEVYATDIKTIEGNASNMVKEKSYDAASSSILGYGIFPEQPKEEIAAILGMEIEDEEATEEIEEIEEESEGSEVADEASSFSETAVSSELTRGWVVDNETSTSAVNRSNSDGIMPLADGDGHGDVVIESINGTVDYDEDNNWFYGKIEITFDVDTQDLEEGIYGTLDECYFVLPDGLSVPDDLLGNYYTGTMGTSTTPAFTYWFEVDADGNYVIYVDFLDGFYDLAERETVVIEFEGYISGDNLDEEGHITWGTDNEYDGSIEILPGQNASPGADIHTSKSGSYNGVDNAIDYTILISSNQGTGEEEIHITDTFTPSGGLDVILGNSLEITYVGSDGTMHTTTATVTKNADGSYTIEYDLPALGEGQQYEVTYEIPLEDFGSMEVSESAGNAITAKVDKGDDGTPAYDLEDSSDTTVKIVISGVSKSGYLDGESGNITWTIVVNQGGTDITDYVLDDTQLANAVDGSLTVEVQWTDDWGNVNWSTASSDLYEIITNADGSKSIRFKADSSGSNHYIFRITYTTELTTADGQLGQTEEITNDVELKDEEGETKAEDTGIVDATFGELTKSYVHAVSEDGDTVVINWHSTITVPSGGIAAGTVIEDDLNSYFNDWERQYYDNPSQYYTYDQITALIDTYFANGLTFSNESGASVTISASDLTIEVYDHDLGRWVSYSQISSSDRFTAWRVTINSEHTEDAFAFGDLALEMDYASTGDLSGIEGTTNEVTFTNRITVGDLVAEDSFKEGNPVLKTNGKDQTTDEDHGDGTTGVVIEEDGTLVWKVDVYIPEDYTNSFTVTDYLPAGVELESLTIVGESGIFAETELTQTGENTWSCTLTWWGMNEQGEWGDINSTVEATVGSYVTEDGETAQTVVLVIPSEVSKLLSEAGGRTFTITYTVKLTDEELAALLGDNGDGTDENGNMITKTYKNTVEVKYGDEDYGKAEHSEEVYFEPPTDEEVIVDKSVIFDPDNNLKVVNYHVVLNPGEEDLLKAGDSLMFTDTAQFGTWGGQDITLALDVNSVKFWHVADGGYVTLKEGTTTDIYGYGTFIDSEGNEIVYSSETADSVYIEAVTDSNGEVKYHYYKLLEQLSVEWTYTSDGTYFTITGMVPDETAILVIYNYAIRYGDDVTANDGFWINNTARLIGDEEWGDTNQESTVIGDVSTSGHTEVNDVLIWKVSKGNYGIVLPDTVFELYYWDTTTSAWVKAAIPAEVLTTSSEGTLDVSRALLEEYECFFEDTAYYLVEVQAKEGYLLDEDPAKYYFYWSSSDDITIDQVAGPDGFSDYSASDLSGITRDLYIENTPVPTTDIGIEKLWKDESGNEVSPGALESIHLNLYRYAVKGGPVDDGSGSSSGSSGDSRYDGTGSAKSTRDDTVYVYIDYGFDYTHWVYVGEVYKNQEVKIEILSSEQTGYYVKHSNNDSGDNIINWETLHVGSNEIVINAADDTDNIYIYIQSATSSDFSVWITEGEYDGSGGTGDGSGSGSLTDPGAAGEERTEPELIGTVTIVPDANGNWSYTVTDLPEYTIIDDYYWYYYYYFEEEPINGWTSSGGGSYGSGVSDGRVTITNTCSNAYTLPKTGGIGTRRLALIGVLVIAMGVGVLLYRDSRRKRRCER